MRAIRSFAVCAALALPGAPVCADEPPVGVPPTGFTALFNGADLAGWRGAAAAAKSRAGMSAEALAAAQVRADELMRSHWSVDGGVLRCDGGGDNIGTAGDFENFELYVDWRVEPGSDSGIYLRGVPQVQIWDPADEGERRVGSGGLFNNRQFSDEPLVCADRPVGEWNTLYIMMMGDRVSVKLNDKLVVDDVVLENYWERGAPLATRGPIELQGGGGPVSFRNVFVRELPRTPSPPWQVLFDGEGLDAWDAPPRGWRIEDGELVPSRRRRNPESDNTLWTKERYGDFLLELEFKLSPESESGVFIRTGDREDRRGTGLEIQLADSHGVAQPGARDCGAVYDILAPRFSAVRPPEEWNQLKLVAQENLLSVVLNGERIIDLDLDQRPATGGNADDSSEASRAGRPIPGRDGFIGLEDGGNPVSFRNVRIKRLD
jgi:hypothetical protein